MGSMGSSARDWPHIPLEAVGGGDHPAAGEQGACTVVGPVLLDAHDPGPLGIGAVLTTHDPVKLLGLPTGWGCLRRRSHFIIPGAQASRPVHAPHCSSPGHSLPFLCPPLRLAFPLRSSHLLVLPCPGPLS